MSVLLATLMALLLIAITALIVMVVYAAHAEDRDERAQIERETRRAEYRLHRLASDAFTHMMDVAREHGLRSEE